MLEFDLLGRSRADFAALRRPRLAAIFSYRFDAHLVPALKHNLLPIVDAFVSFDDRSAEGTFSSEPDRRRALIDAAQELGADWVLAMDPDERIESGAGPTLRRLMESGRHQALKFALRELYLPNAYRVDGIWGRKSQDRMFQLQRGMRLDYAALHSPWVQTGKGFAHYSTGLNIYHLKMLTAERRQARRDLYATLDPKRKLSRPGYDYLSDEAGLRLAEIPASRMYEPEHVEDGGLWMQKTEPALADPPRSRAGASRQAHKFDPGRASGQLAATFAAMGRPVSPPTSQFAGTGTVEKAVAASLVASAAKPADAALHANLIHGLGLLGRDAERRQKIAALAAAQLTGDPLECMRLQPPLGASRDIADFVPLGWCREAVHVTWGKDANIDAGMAVVAIGLDAPSALAEAVDSLLAQKPCPLVIVVNSGSAGVENVLGNRKDHVILAQVPHRVFVGAARNIGASLTCAPWVAFLAGDCTAEPGWAAARLQLHRGGLQGVSSAVAPARNASRAGIAQHLFLFGARLPKLPVDMVFHYGMSYDRLLIAASGWFDPKLRIAEDTKLNESFTRDFRCEFASEVLTLHRASQTLAAARADVRGRSRRLAACRPAGAQLGLDARVFPLFEANLQLMFTRIRGRWKQRRQIGVAYPEYRGWDLSVFAAALEIASAAGSWAEFPAEIRARRAARAVRDQCLKGDAAAAAHLIAEAGPDFRIGPRSALELADVLKRSGLNKEAWQVLDFVASRFVGVPALEAALAEPVEPAAAESDKDATNPLPRTPAPGQTAANQTGRVR